MSLRRKKDDLLPANQLKKPKIKSTQSSQMLSEWDKIEEDWCEQRCNSLSRGLIQMEAPKPSRPSTSALNLFDVYNDGNENDFENQFPVDNDEDDDPLSDISESEAESVDSHDSEQSIASGPGTGCVVTAVTGDNNQKRRIREERQWQEVIEPMFKAYMLCKQLTLNWSRAVTWDSDWKEDCRCSAAKKRIRHLEMMDIMSNFIPLEILEFLKS
ncbi:uncharacterized protein MELLADRAFT_63184 [Melampsora larici-populina 98AG31]|uniref:CxC1-like cysteine cluster associated with KDZ transposases domain-containing protein n=1 Tax=Melampsora larici-populina (strain 98AG31 / pathotype 3-4-7) TaxID=747676 RepID=F4RLR0_MELLP|nr:uncharacterized protein MELLADRAFT_63184 [Melampsora larici-populina 98AG31]EGG06581.1 hypothetical protein MELLADRAFT_63184 [Melampsora larici-populina 98AG31]